MVLNLSYLEEITGGDSEMVIEMLNLFIRDIPGHSKNMESFLADNKLEELRAEAHKVKPTLQYIGLTEVFEIVRTIELNIKNGENIEVIPELVNQFSAQVIEVLPLLEEKRAEFL